MYTSGEIFPFPSGTTNYWHKSLNVKKNCETGYCPMPGANVSMSRYVK